jgi:AraC-like DNA-binding protein
MPRGVVFDWHTHADHQLAWAAKGVLTVRTETTAFVLPPTRAMWIPAGVRHETLSAGSATMRSAYVSPASCPIDWRECTPVGASQFLAELLGYLEDTDVGGERRHHAEVLLLDLVRPVPMSTVQVRMPVEERASQVARSLAELPSDGRTAAEWGREVGASGRTLERLFLAETGVPFGRWRALMRLQTAIVKLAGGESVGNAARQVGYESVSAFVAAFRRETGTTPAVYFRQGGPRHATAVRR